MSEDAPDRPLTRRELRLRAMAETGDISTITAAENQARAEAEALAQAEATKAAAAQNEAATSASRAEMPGSSGEDIDDIEIAQYNDDGTPRTRREIRALREQALAARRSAQQATEGSEAPAAVVPPVAPEAPARTELDPRLADTQPFSTEDLEEVLESEDASHEVANGDIATAAEAVSERGVGSIPDDDGGEPGAASAGSDGVEGADEADSVSGAEQAERLDTADYAEVLVEDEPDTPMNAEGAHKDQGSEQTREVEASTDSAPEPQSARNGYSFPDIAPLEENPSIFDRPDSGRSSESAPGSTDESGDFDDLIHRAVAQESSNVSTNTSALILPSMPNNGGLSGPLGETGELFITGSVEMPKSIGETGQQPSLHDSTDFDPLDELGFDAAQSTDAHAPVSARRAVGSTGKQAPISEHSKEKSRMPIVLISTGGALLLAIAGLVTWAVASGMFG